MRTILTIIFASCIIGHAQNQEFKPASPPYCTPQEFKVFWYNQMPVPRTMDRDFHSLTKARQLFVLQVKAGQYDLAASKAAAEYNLRAANQRGDSASSSKFMAELQACESAIAAAEQRAQLEKGMAGIERMGQEQREQSARATRDMQGRMQQMESETRSQMEQMRQKQQQMQREAEQQKTQQWMEEQKRNFDRIQRESQQRIDQQARDMR